MSRHFEKEHPQHVVEEENLPMSVIAIEKLQDIGSDEEKKAKRLEREKFWIDTLFTYYPKGLNNDPMHLYEKYLRKISKTIPFIVPFSETGRKAGELVKTYYKNIQEEHDHFSHKVVIAFKKHKNLRDLLVSSKV